MKVLFVGGPLDGERMEVSSRDDLYAGKPLTRYRIARFAGEFKEWFVGHPLSITVDEAVARLFDAYGAKQ